MEYFQSICLSSILVNVVLMSRKFDDFEQLLPIHKRNVILTPVQNQEFYRPRNNPGTSYDYEYDYDLVDRAPGYDVYRSRDDGGGDRVAKYLTNCSEVSETQFVTEYKDSCSIVYEKSCKKEFIQSYNKKALGPEVSGKCVSKYKTKCSRHEMTQNKGKAMFICKSMFRYY